MTGDFREENLQRAERLAELGLAVMPIKWQDKRPALGSWKRWRTERPGERQVRAWFDQPHPINVAIITGQVSGVIVVDADSDEAIEWVECALPFTPFVVDTAHGAHYFYAHPGDEPIGNRAGAAPGVDIRGDAGYVVGPGSLHESGTYYSVRGELPEDLAGLPVFDPAWFPERAAPEPAASRGDYSPPRRADGATPYAAAALRDECAQVAGCGEGERNNRLNIAAHSMGTLVGGGQIDAIDVEMALEEAARAAGLGEREAKRTIKSGLEAGRLKPRWPEERRSSASSSTSITITPRSAERLEQALEQTRSNGVSSGSSPASAGGASGVILSGPWSAPERTRSSFQVLVNMARDELVWKQGGKAYSKRQRRQVSQAEWVAAMTPDHLRALLEESEGLAYVEGKPEWKRERAARAEWRAWAGAAFHEAMIFMEVRNDQATHEDQAQIHQTVRDLLAKPLRVNTTADEIPINRSIIESSMMCESKCWTPVGHFSAFIQSGPDVALRYEFVIGQLPPGHATRSLSKGKLARELERAGIAETRVIRVGQGTQRAYVINPKWLDNHFDTGRSVQPDGYEVTDLKAKA